MRIIRTWGRICTNAYVCAYVQTCMIHSCMYAYIHAYTLANMPFKFVHSHTHTHIHQYKHIIYKHIHAHIFPQRIFIGPLCPYQHSLPSIPSPLVVTLSIPIFLPSFTIPITSPVSPHTRSLSHRAPKGPWGVVARATPRHQQEPRARAELYFSALRAGEWTKSR